MDVVVYTKYNSTCVYCVHVYIVYMCILCTSTCVYCVHVFIGYLFIHVLMAIRYNYNHSYVAMIFER